MKLAMPAEQMAMLRDPRLTVPEFGRVVDQRTEDVIPYDVDAVSPKVQRSILGYLGDPPKNSDGFNLRLLLVGPRQCTKTSTTVLGISNLVEYSPGTTGATIADTRDRAKELIRHAVNNYEYKDPSVKYPSTPSIERNQMTFAHGGKYYLLSAEQGNAGIGRGAAFLHLSELPFWSDPGDVWYKLSPAFRNRKNALIVAESTPAPASEPGAAWFREFFEAAWHGAAISDEESTNMFIPVFSTFFESKLNERRWRKGWVPTLEELRLLELHGPKGGQPLTNPGNVDYLTLENLAFMRFVHDNDPLVKQNPDLFWTFYPIDEVTCWETTGGGFVPSQYLEYLRNVATVAWERGDVYKEYEQPDPDAVYVLALDPSGYGTGDPAAFHVLKVWADAPPEQVAEYETNEHDPPMQAIFVARAATKYNNALIIVENNRDSALALLEAATSSNGLELVNELGEFERIHVKNLYYHKVGTLDQRPGIHSNKKTNPEAFSALVLQLRNRMVIRGAKTYSQIASYKKDKDDETPERSKRINPDKEARGRRQKHHWDRVSALGWGCWAIDHALIPQRFKPVAKKETKKVEGYTVADLLQWQAKQKKQQDKSLQGDARIRKSRYGRGRR